ncbi:13476_t:CDS:1, partial [Funneliformis mosseae]
EVEQQDVQEQDTNQKKSDHTIDTFAKNVADYSLLKELGMIEEAETEELAGYFE